MMSKKKDKTPRKKDSSQIEHYKGELRKARKAILVLRKELEKSIHYRPKQLDEIMPEEKKEDTNCPKCQHKLKFIQLPIKDIILCPNCSYRNTLPKKEE